MRSVFYVYTFYSVLKGRLRNSFLTKAQFTAWIMRTIYLSTYTTTKFINYELSKKRNRYVPSTAIKCLKCWL